MELELKGKMIETFEDEISEIILLGREGKIRRIILDEKEGYEVVGSSNGNIIKTKV